MDVNVKMRHLLKGRRADGMPKAQAIVGKHLRHRTRDTSHAGHHRGAGSLIQFPHVVEMGPRNHQHMTRMELPQIDKCQRQLIGKYDVGRRAAGSNRAEHTVPYAVLCAHRGCNPRAPISVRKNMPGQLMLSAR